MTRKLITTLLTAVFVCIATVGFSIDTKVETFHWDPPTNLINGTDCSDLGAELTPEQLADMVYVVTIQIGTATPVQYEVVGVTTFSTPPIPVGSVVVATVGAKRPGGVVACFSDSLMWTIPVPNVSPCRNFLKE